MNIFIALRVLGIATQSWCSATRSAHEKLPRITENCPAEIALCRSAGATALRMLPMQAVRSAIRRLAPRLLERERDKAEETCAGDQPDPLYAGQAARR